MACRTRAGAVVSMVGRWRAGLEPAMSVRWRIDGVPDESRRWRCGALRDVMLRNGGRRALRRGDGIQPEAGCWTLAGFSRQSGARRRGDGVVGRFTAAMVSWPGQGVALRLFSRCWSTCKVELPDSIYVWPCLFRETDAPLFCGIENATSSTAKRAYKKKKAHYADLYH